MAQSSRPSLVSIASAYVSDESNVVCVLHACTYAQACVHDLCTVIEGWEAWILHTSGANRRRIINALTQTSLKRTLSLIVGVGLTLLHWIRLVVFDSFLSLLFFFGKYSMCEIVRGYFVSYCLISVWLRLVSSWLDVDFSFPFLFLGIILVLEILEMEILFGIWKSISNFEKNCRRMDRWNFFFFRILIFEIVNLLATDIDCIARVPTKTFFFNSSTSILKFSILWIRGRSVNPITCFSNPSSSGTKRYSRFVVREVNRHGS